MILAAGGQALPKSGSDGSGYALARALGHTTTATIFPSLVPLVVPDDHWLRTVQGIAVPARIEVRAGSGKRLATFRGDLLCTHFGLSGPVVLDASRHYLAARQADRQARFVVAFLPDATAENLTLELAQPRAPQPRTLAGGEAPRPAGGRPAHERRARSGRERPAPETRGAPGAPAGPARARDPDHRRPRLRPRRGDRRRHPARPGPAGDDGVAPLPGTPPLRRDSRRRRPHRRLQLPVGLGERHGRRTAAAAAALAEAPQAAQLRPAQDSAASSGMRWLAA